MNSRFDTGVSPRENYYDDNAGAPTPATFFKDNLVAEELRIPAFLSESIHNELNQAPQTNSPKMMVENIDKQLSDPNLSWPNYLAGEAGSWLGAINPFNIAASAITTPIGRGIIGGISSIGERIVPNALTTLMRRPIKEAFNDSLAKFIPDMVGKVGSEEPLSLSLLGKRGAEHFINGAGFGIPDALINNFEADSNHINWGGVGKDLGVMGAMGIGFGSLFGAIGIVRAKINRGKGTSPSENITPNDVTAAVNQGHITPQEGQYAMDLDAHKANVKDDKVTADLQQRASNIVNDNGHKANSVSHEVPFEIMNPQQLNNFQSTVLDRIAATDLPPEERSAATDFIVADTIDGLRNNRPAIDAARGYVLAIDEKFKAKPDQLKQIDKIIDEHLTKDLDQHSTTLAQEQLAKKKLPNEESFLAVLPDNVKAVRKINEKIAVQRKKLKSGRGDQNQIEDKIKNLEASKPTLLTPAEELTYLREKLLKDGLPKNYQHLPDYLRLQDLAEVWKNAKGLLYRVDLEAEYNRQEAFRDLTQQVIDLVDSSVEKFADNEKMKSYLDAREVANRSDTKEKPTYEKAIAEAKQVVPADAVDVLERQAMQLNKSKGKESTKKFNQSFEKFKEFKGGEKPLNNLISCVMGALGIG